MDDSVRADGPSGEHRRHRVLAGVSRARLLAVLRRSREPVGVRELAAAVGLHPNTAREHLDQLVAAGLVTREVATPTGRGRPGHRYSAEPASAAADPDAYRLLAMVLAAELATRDDAAAAAIDAGERWGVRAAGGLAPADGVDDPVDRLVGMLDDLGFAPERTLAADGQIRLRRCPFGSLVDDHGMVVCNVHLGLMRGALRQLGAPFDAVSLEPFASADWCLANVGARADAP